MTFSLIIKVLFVDDFELDCPKDINETLLFSLFRGLIKDSLDSDYSYFWCC